MADGEKKVLRKGDGILTPTDVPVGIRTEESAIYTEIAVMAQDIRETYAWNQSKWKGEEDIMNEVVKAGEVF